MQPIIDTLDLSLIVAMTPGRVIGRNGSLPWKIPSDMKRFARITKEVGVVIMGRATWDSLPAKFKPLPGRHNVVLTRDCSLRTSDSVEFVSSVEEALAVVAAHGGKACIIGGEQIYKLFLPLVRTAHITTIYDDSAPIKGDAYFPELNLASEWRIRDSSSEKQPEGDQFPTSFEELVRG